MSTIILILIDAIYSLLAIFYLPSFIFRGKRRLGIKERWGIYSADLNEKFKTQKQNIWLHAVSVGEIKAAASFISLLRARFPRARIIISTITPAGNAVARQIAFKDDVVIYFPFDLSFIVKRALSLINPAMILIMETELWPNLILEAAKRAIPIAIINGRISDKAFPRYQLGALFFKRVLKNITLFCMQTQIDSQRIIKLGAPAGKVHIVGNIKFDQLSCLAGASAPDLGIAKGERLIVAGSTYEGEEEILARVFIRLKANFPDICLLIAPRHLNRIADIESMLKKHVLPCVIIRSIEKKAIISKDSIFLLDVMGVLGQIYQLADIVFVGGSLVPHGGQNPIEPAACKKPVIFGRYMFNFSEIAKMFLDNNAALRVDNEQELYETLKEILRDTNKKNKLAESAYALVLKNRGSSQRIMELLEKNIPGVFS